VENDEQLRDKTGEMPMQVDMERNPENQVQQQCEALIGIRSMGARMLSEL